MLNVDLDLQSFYTTVTTLKISFCKESSHEYFSVVSTASAEVSGMVFHIFEL